MKSLNNIRVICGWPGIGRGYLIENGLDDFTFLNLSSEHLSWLKNKRGEYVDLSGKLVSEEDKVANPNLQIDYVAYIVESLKSNDFLFASTDENIKRTLFDIEIPFCIVYPERELKEEYLERYKIRNSAEDESLIPTLEFQWNNFIDVIENDQRASLKIKLKTGEYLGSIFRR